MTGARTHRAPATGRDAETDAETVRAAADMWVLAEAVHAVTYFTPEARAAHEQVGLRGFWRGYFATRAAPLGAVGPGVVTAVFAGFAWGMVTRALPQVWSVVAPEVALRARVDGAVAALRAHAGPLPDPVDIGDAVALLRRVVDALELAGRPLGAANAVLDWPDEPLAALWHGTTVVREYRGDGHVAVLTAEGLDGCAAHVFRAARDGSRDLLQPNRGFTDDDWEHAAATLRGRGLLDTAGALTTEGHRLHEHVAARTDALAATGWQVLDDEGTGRLRALLGLLASRLAGGAVPYPNPVGAPAPPVGPG